MATATAPKQCHSSTDLSPATHPHQSHNHLCHSHTPPPPPPPVTIPTVPPKPPIVIPTLDTTSLDQHNSGTLRPPPSPVRDRPESPLTPTSASDLRVPNPLASYHSAILTTSTSTRPGASFRSHSNSSEFSPSSVTSSPGVEHIPRMTPLPSPIAYGGSPGPWHRIRSRSVSRPTSRSSLSMFNSGDSVFVTTAGEPLSQAVSVQSQRKLYQGLASAASQNSSVHAPGEVALDVPSQNPTSKSQHVTTVCKTEPGLRNSGSSAGLKREECLQRQVRHRATSIESTIESSPQPASGAPSLSSPSSVSSADTAATALSDDKELRIAKKLKFAEFEACTIPANETKRWKAIRLLGQGTFSKVILATSEDNLGIYTDRVLAEDGLGEDKDRGLDPKHLVAVKIIESGAAGGACRDRVESSLKRELDILKSVNHPSLVQLKAFNIQPTRALLILSYCAGGDMFDLVSQHRELLTPPLIRRLFAELLGAVQYLHANGIVHRDVKLENVLMNLTPSQISGLANPLFGHPYSFTTLTDLGLSRCVDFANDPMLTTRCGSEDYAAPELLMGQPYDGRQTDAWALGVLLYALLEGRLPFDPLPGSGNKMRSQTAHRIARCEWKWFSLNSDSETYNTELEGGKEIVNGLLKRVNKRLGLDEIEGYAWVKEAIGVPLKK